ncbi:CBS domain-containing protein [Psychroflexus sp. S27]|uniref:CBS domain-containing protein n=1 Tax=Psychroflexus sp. S27 TaxID=1982757 RepID=UPI000C2B32E3|nr:CBS domain-containing protein [Psychroflexus sp. S27]PJX27506.1 CBS domain-containing protein [Psychroflexus sp. S27]
MEATDKISKIMTNNLIKLNVNDSLSKAESLFKKNKIRHIPVVKDDKIIGMLSYTDLMRISFADATDDDGQEIETTVYEMFTLEQVMTKNVEVVTEHTTIKEAAEIFAKKEFHALPVIKYDKIVGIVTTTDIIKYLLEQY